MTIHNQKEKEKSKPYRKNVSKSYKLKKKKKKNTLRTQNPSKPQFKTQKKNKAHTIRINIIYTKKTQQTFSRSKTKTQKT